MRLSFDISNQYVNDTKDENEFDEMALVASCECEQGLNRFLIGVRSSDSAYLMVFHQFVSGAKVFGAYYLCPSNVVKIINDDLDSAGGQLQEKEQMLMFGKCFSDSNFVGGIDIRLHSPINEVVSAYQNHILRLSLGL